MSLLAECSAVDVSPSKIGAQQITDTREIDPSQLAEFAAAVESQFPQAEKHEKAITGGGNAPTGDKMVPFAVRTRVPKGNCVVYYNGKVVLSGAMTSLEWPLSDEAIEFDD